MTTGQPGLDNCMYTLYYAPGAASMCVHLALLEANADYTLKLVDLAAGQQRSAEYLKLNPYGVVPTLLVDGVAYREAAALLMAVAERHPDAGLAPPAATGERIAWYQWIAFLANTLQPAFRLWFYPADGGGADMEAAVKDAARARIETAWQHIDAHLAAHGPYLLGARFSAADILLTMLLRWSRNMPKPGTEWPALRAFAATAKARPSWKRLYEREGLTEWA